MQRLIPALLFGLLAFVSCTKSDTDDQQKLLNDQWYVAYFETIPTGTTVPTDKTSDFTGFTFEFNDNDELVVRSPNGSNATAQWKALDNDTKMGIKMANPFAPIDALMGNWHITEKTANSLELKSIDAFATGPNFSSTTVYFKKQ
ncbi:MAG: hypothetical protein KF734_01935 [Saprospiraceae bacterium]|nr:hypothetical protein [Saprospiraceae bacterium]